MTEVFKGKYFIPCISSLLKCTFNKKITFNIVSVGGKNQLHTT